MKIEKTKGVGTSAVVAIIVIIIAIAGIGGYLVLTSGVEEEGGLDFLWSYKVKDYLESVSLSGDGKYIAIGGGDPFGDYVEDGYVQLFSRAVEHPLWSYTTASYVKSVSISADGSYIAAGSNRKLYLLSRAGNVVWAYPPESRIMDVDMVAISFDGTYIAAGNLWGVLFFSRNEGTSLWGYSFEPRHDGVSHLSISPFGSYVTAFCRGIVKESPEGTLISDPTGTLVIYTFDATGRLLEGFPFIPVTVDDPGIVRFYGAGGSFLLLSEMVDWTNNLYVYKREDEASLYHLWVKREIDYWTSSIAISSDGSYIVVGGYAGMSLFKIGSTLKPVWSYQAHEIERVDISADGSFITAVDLAGNVYLFGPEDNVPVGRCRVGSQIDGVLISPDGSTIVAYDLYRGGRIYVIRNLYSS